MPSPLHNAFLGHKPDVANPPFNSAKAGQNYSIHRHRDRENKIAGWIEQSDGYAKKFSALPANDLAIKKIANISYQDIYNLWIPDHGGQNVTVVVATYTKTGYELATLTGTAWAVAGGSLTKVTGTGTKFLTETAPGSNILLDSTQKVVLSVTSDTELYVTVAFGGAASGTSLAGSAVINRFGIFIRPYWNGSTWIDEWFETTEMMIFEIDSLGTGDGSAFLNSSGWVVDGLGFWSGSFAAGWTHSALGGAGSTDPLTQTTAAVNATYYDISWTVTGRTNGSFTIAFGGNTISGLTATGTQRIKSSSTGNLVITPTSNFDGKIVFSIITEGNVKKIYLDDITSSKYHFPTIDSGATVFKTDYFKNWTIVDRDFHGGDNYELVAASGYDGSQYYLGLIHPNNEFYSAWTAGDKLLVYRSLLELTSTGTEKQLPSSIDSFIYGLLSEARLTTGNDTTDVVLSLASKTTAFTTISTHTSDPYVKTIDEVIAGPGVLDIWKYAAVISFEPTPIPDAAGLPAGTYYLKHSIVMDDGSETALYDSPSEVGGSPADWSGTNFLTLTEASNIKIYAHRSWGTLPARGRFLRCYVSDDNVYFYKMKDFDLRSSTLFDAAAMRGISLLGGQHYFAVGYAGYLLTDLDWSAATGDSGIEATAQIGRKIDDTGVIQFKAATVAGRICYAIGVRKDATVSPNTIFASLQTGDGAPARDVFGLVANNMIDLEYGDGDELAGIYSKGDVVLAWKRQRLMSVREGSDANGKVVYLADTITQADGLCSRRSIVGFEDVIYWAGYNGIYSYSSQGVLTLNRDWLEEWKAVDVAYKETAVASFDRTNRQYRIAYNGLERLLDIDTGEWTPGVPTDQPAVFAANQRLGTVDFLSGSLIQTLGSGTRHDGVNFSMEYFNNDFLAHQLDPKGRATQNWDVLLYDVRVAYNSSVALTLTLYRDGIAQSPVAGAAGNGSVTIKAGKSFRCKKFGLKIIATTTADNQVVQIKEIQPRYDLIPTGVSTPAFASEGTAAAIDQRPMALADIRSGKYNLTAGVLTTVPYSYPFSVAVGTDYQLKADVYNNAGEWIMSAEASNQTRNGFDITSPEDGYVRYIAASNQ
jgi:hypothetical protein